MEDYQTFSGVLNPADVFKIATGNRQLLRTFSLLMVIAEADSSIKFGDVTVTAVSGTDQYIPAKVPVFLFTGPYAYIAVAGTGPVWVSILSWPSELTASRQP